MTNLRAGIMRIEKEPLIQKTLRLLEFDSILERLAGHAMSEEAAAMIRGEKPLSDPAAVAKTKEAVQSIISLINAGGKEPRRHLPSIGFLLPRLDVDGTILEIDEACAFKTNCPAAGKLPPPFSAFWTGMAM